MNAEQSMPVNNGIILIDAMSCPTISNKVLCTGDNLFTTRKIQLYLNNFSGREFTKKSEFLSVILLKNKSFS